LLNERALFGRPRSPADAVAYFYWNDGIDAETA
jgi:hypothetical protein